MKRPIFIVILLIIISGCTSLSENECHQGNWQALGYNHGQQGYTLTEGSEIILSCHEFGIHPNMEAYKESYQKGLATFCVPENGFTQGLDGKAYNGICQSKPFRKAWEEGHDRYLINARIEEVEQRIEDIYQQLKTIKNKLSQSQLAQAERNELINERNALKKEQKDLRREQSLLPLMNKIPSFQINYGG